ncbi:MAG: methylmalonyl-CoA mutase family protein [Candidatus Zixiibacteriota bacterium]|nr:MAG: methylmalonyl-CoA mutase family protein [candidate division Zixibacteria bacterium]
MDEKKTSSGIPIKRIYSNIENIDHLKSDAGEYPFTRGIYREMYRERFWTMRQYAGFGTAKKSNERYRYLLKKGQTGLSVAFDLPTQIGYDSDHPMAAGEVGKTGVAIDSLADMEILFDKIPLDKVSTSMTINATAFILLALYIAVAKKQNVSLNKLKGTVQNDILKEYFARGTYIFQPKPSLRLVSDIFKYCKEYVPNWNSISISGYHIREAGATAAQEVAFTLADGICYVEHALKAGLEVDEFAPRLSFFFNAHNDLFEEIAKFRAARYVWARIMRDRFKAKDDRSCMLRFHTQTAGSMLTAQQPENNIARVTVQALAAVLGGTQSLHTNSMDEALALPSEKSATIALRTQQIIAHESGAGTTVDPLGGSYYIENLTLELVEKIESYISEIDKLGGALKAVEKGYFQTEIQKSAYEYQKQVESKEKIVVGVNEFISDSEEPQNLLKVDPELEKKQIEFVKSIRKKRNSSEVGKRLEELKNTANSDKNIIPVVIDCVESMVTVGEICGVLREIWGEYKENLVL